jgi:hypothetical protein
MNGQHCPSARRRFRRPARCSTWIGADRKATSDGLHRSVYHRAKSSIAWREKKTPFSPASVANKTDIFAAFAVRNLNHSRLSPCDLKCELHTVGWETVFNLVSIPIFELKLTRKSLVTGAVKTDKALQFHATVNDSLCVRALRLGPIFT